MSGSRVCSTKPPRMKCVPGRHRYPKPQVSPPAYRAGFGGVRAAVDRLDAHLLHQRGDVSPPGPRPPLKHFATSDAAKVKSRCNSSIRRIWARSPSDTGRGRGCAATAEAEKPPGARRIACARGRFWLLSAPAIPPCRAHRIKIALQCQFADFRVQRFDIDGRTRRLRFRFIAPNTPVAPRELVFPLLDLAGRTSNCWDNSTSVCSPDGGKCHLA